MLLQLQMLLMLLILAAAVVRHLVTLAAGGCLVMLLLMLLMTSAMAHLSPLYPWVQAMLQALDPAHVPAFMPHAYLHHLHTHMSNKGTPYIASCPRMRAASAWYLRAITCQTTAAAGAAL
jgi:putative effector of murein hydrolase LrgA (UPF0299 family)